MKKILVIDDSEVNLFLLQAIFEEMDGIQVEIESNSSEAFSRLREGNPDLLFIDLMMPVHGFDIIKKMKETPEFRKLPIVVVSALHDDETKEKARSFGVDEIVSKPIFTQEIEAIVRKYLYS